MTDARLAEPIAITLDAVSAFDLEYLERWAPSFGVEHLLDRALAETSSAR